MREPTLPAGALAATIDRDGRCRAVSPGLLQWWGLNEHDVVGAPAGGLAGPANAEALAAALHAIWLGQACRLRWRITCLTQADRWLAVHLAPRHGSNGSVVACDLLAMDISGEQQAIEAARRGERRLRVIMDQIPVTVSYIDADLHYRYINRAQEQWLGKPEAEVTGRSVPELVGEKVWSDIEPNLRVALSGENVLLERQRVDRQGQPVWHSGRHVPDVNDDGVVVGVYTVFFDITERALAERRRLQREQDLSAA